MIRDSAIRSLSTFFFNLVIHCFAHFASRLYLCFIYLMIHSFYSEVLNVLMDRCLKRQRRKMEMISLALYSLKDRNYILNSYPFLAITKAKECKNNVFLQHFVVFAYFYLFRWGLDSIQRPHSFSQRKCLTSFQVLIFYLLLCSKFPKCATLKMQKF